MTTKRMIFHAPFAVGEYHSQSASGIRPQKMLAAFEEQGYEVALVTGTVRERKKAIEHLRDRIRAGEVFDFVYSESTTKPHIFTGRHKYPLNPFFDYAFFRFCRKHRIPVGLYYRDVYWRFPEFTQDLGWLKATILKPFYVWDLLNYRHALDVLFVPSFGYSDRLPRFFKLRVAELPPGAEVVGEADEVGEENLLYIGGLGAHYRMHEVFEAVARSESVSLTLSTREREWELVKHEYPMLGRVSVVHRSGAELNELYEAAKYALIFMETTDYRSFAVPYKLYEYLGRGKPIIASSGTYAGELVEQLGIGWTIPYESEALVSLLRHLREDSTAYSEVISRVRRLREVHTWEHRTKQVRHALQHSE